MKGTYRTADAAAVRCPTLVLYGAQDPRVLPDQARAVFPEIFLRRVEEERVKIQVVPEFQGVPLDLLNQLEKMKRERISGELNSLVTAIEAYKAKFGSYPPDNLVTAAMAPAGALQRLRWSVAEAEWREWLSVASA